MPVQKIKLVLDTNTLISGLLWKGNEFQLLEKIEQGKAFLFLTKEIISEIDRVLHYQRLESYILKAGISIEELLKKIISLSHIILESSVNINVCRDPEDNKFIECAVLANARYVVTGDEDLLVLKEYKDINIITTNEALKLIS